MKKSEEKVDGVGENPSPEASELNEPEELDMTRFQGRVNVPKKKVRFEQTVIPIEMPKGKCVKMHPSASVDVCMVKYNEELYLVGDAIIPSIERDIKDVTLYLGMTEEGALFFLPVPKDTDGKGRNSWVKSKEYFLFAARQRWIRPVSDRAASCYDIGEPVFAIPDVPWPEDLSVSRLLAKAFHNHILDNEDHPVVKKLLVKKVNLDELHQ